jgi:hypothetical protein
MQSLNGRKMWRLTAGIHKSMLCRMIDNSWPHCVLASFLLDHTGG